MKMKISHELINISDLKENYSNPRMIVDRQFEKLKKSLQDHPWMLKLREIIIDENNVVLCGNMRFKALLELKEEKILVKRITGLSRKRKEALIIKDNKNFGEWDFDDLANEFELKDLLDWGFELGEFGMKWSDDKKCPHCGGVIK